MKVFPTEFEYYLELSMLNRGAKYELQYIDYDENTWTAPVLLTEERIKQIVSDKSIKNVRLSFSI